MGSWYSVPLVCVWVGWRGGGGGGDVWLENIEGWMS